MRHSGATTVLAEQLDLSDGFTTLQLGTTPEVLEKAQLPHSVPLPPDIGLHELDVRQHCQQTPRPV